MRKRVQKNIKKAMFVHETKREENLKTMTDMPQPVRERESCLWLIDSPILPFCKSFNYVSTA